MRLNFTKIFLAAAIVLAATVTSCKAPQSLAYFENADSLKTVGTTALDYAVKIRPADELIITVNSIVPVAAHPLEKRVIVHCAGGNGSLQPSARQSVA